MNVSELIAKNTLITSLVYCVVSLLLFQSLGYVFCVSILLICIFKISVSTGAVKKPSNIIVNLLAITVIVVVFLSLGFQKTIEMFVAMLLGACSLKMLKVSTKQQAQSVYLLNFFTYPCFYLFSQNILSFLFVAALLLLNLSQLFSVTHHMPIKQSINNSVRKFIFSLPLAVVMVVLVPKLPPFWQLPNAKNAATGLSEDVDPFQISDLSRSSELAFRALLPESSGFQPPFYWRAIIHDSFDGKRWGMSNLQARPLVKTYEPVGPATYSVISNPSNTRWLYTLGAGLPASNGTRVNYFGILYQRNLSNKPMQYEVSPIKLDDARISQWEFNLNTRLPSGINPKAVALAKQLNQSAASTETFIINMKAFFLAQSFQYSLSPPSINSNDSIDEFLFETQEGFCGHYASSAAFLMRSVGIPTRLVSGYLGGEFNYESNYYAVYQYDAHAWVEYYVPQLGWQRLDPTAWVSPQRILGSLSDMVELEQEFNDNLGFSLHAFADIAAINWLRLKLEQIDFQWTRWVLNFDDKKQSSLLEMLFGQKNKLLPALSVVGLLIIVFGLWFIYINVRSKFREPKEVRIYNHLMMLSDEKSDKLTPKQICDRLKIQWPSAADELTEFYGLFESARYDAQPLSARQYRRLSHLNKQIIKKAKIK
ncbi:transglutaminase TgpA family protein [Pseudoalteromonas luteoviolacea]|uniref:Transglutaminase-like domain-containing protein n=1 Tax=Pseudoalteromonas luteoviolacea S4054 TaxID=1129367 RepID=A0A0F6A557_9GAMM|nr:DUF3488 and DUF4129 domain-containing transglutaminase family protein [Pseudoalteromonas luteoviolacea]AOT10710.1 hypothetical protein S4054249_22910 [Pseudoalteromonas luteoviolacea]AOT16128.1 hypothetical protein S40542_25600 [Pseudoalteromonas luteoviolacea]AOT20530.1 hypothetical protein S4054_22825 [Pseudoalteromonas luteoviolacea]KKE81238.1 hypothetical protein N479_22940 [Pseudoalteromonas luteoviolacea S4054]KZN68999.1 hypothetical protein N481_22920 [Pseudoalteromonas luteoviolacea